MNVLILAAGRGSRLESRTSKIPKCLNKIGNHSLLDWQLAIITKKISNIFLVKGYLGEKIKDKRVSYISNENWHSSNMVESLYISLEKIMNDRTIVSYGDIVYGNEILKKIVEVKEEIAITYDVNWLELWKKRFSDPLEDAETFKVDKDNFITEIGNKSSSYENIQGQFMGLLSLSSYFLKYLKNFLKGMDESTRCKLDITKLLSILIKNGLKIKAIPIYGNWMEIDEPKDLDLAEELIKQKKLNLTSPTDNL